MPEGSSKASTLKRAVRLSGAKKSFMLSISLIEIFFSSKLVLQDIFNAIKINAKAFWNSVFFISKNISNSISLVNLCKFIANEET